ncbi:tail fiber domain-containing protein [Microcoleus sp. C2C3]|uniref:tail fiber domain-containing protein n=1 Tax=unclassified Microcoleus TaxID=2642155 RepID=UPI002FD38072
MTDPEPKLDPFDFLFFYQFEDGREEDALLVGDDPSTASPLHLCIGIKDAKQIVISPIPDVTTASSSNYHFKLQFTPGILLQPEQITVEGDDWGLEVEGDTILYLLWKGEQVTLDDTNSLELMLNRVMGTLTTRASTTQVPLSWEFKQGTITLIEVTAKGPGGSDPNPYNTFTTETLEMIQRQGKANIPLYVGFFSSNRVLNINNQESELKLRITNTSESPITFNYDADATNRSQLIVALEVGEADTVPWALGTVDQLNNVAVTIAGDKWQPAGPTPNGSTLEWTFSPKSTDISLAAKETLVIELKKIVTSHPTGTANLYLRYKYVPDYQDGEFICPIEKAPLVFHDVKVNDQLEHRVGIGTTTPATLLNVRDFLTLGNPDNNQKFVITSRAPQSGDFLQITNDKADGSWDWGQGITLKRGGNVGIGTEAPQAKLDVNGGDALISGKVGIGTTAPQAKLEIIGTGTTFYSAKKTELGIRSELVTIKDGNVGIGTENPEVKLHVNNGNAIFSGNVNFGSTTRQMINLYEQTYGIGVQSSTMYFRTASQFALYKGGSHNNDLAEPSGGTLQLMLDSSGNVGIGTKTPSAKLDVNGDVKVAGNLNFGSTTRQMLNLYGDGYGIGVQGATTYFRSSNHFAWFKGGSHNDASGDAGGGRLQMTLESNNDLTVFGGIISHNWIAIHNSGGLRLYKSGDTQQWKIYPEWNQPDDPDLIFDYSGNPSNWASGWLDPWNGWGRSSDERLKEDIEPVSNVLDRVMKLQPSSYYWRDSNTKSQKSFGFVAQNVETVFPQFVKEKSGFKGLNYDNFTVIAIAAIQEQQQLIASMQEEINNLKTQLQQ